MHHTEQVGRWWRDEARCKDDLALVDATYAQEPGAADEMKRDYCAQCPVAEFCLREAMETGEWGVWGGTTSYWRTKHGSRRGLARLEAQPEPRRLERGRQ